MRTKIIKCDCVHAMQDSMHGKGRRVANSSKDGSKFSCTVCGKTSGDDYTAKKK